MSDDLDLANLLGQAPRSPDPVFRFDIFADIAARKSRRAARRRALAYVAASLLVGLSIPAGHVVGLSFANLWPVLLVAGALGVAYVLAVAAAEGPGALVARSRALLRAPL
ncbi:MAG: hypothetical protein AB7O98_01005 [Hyphomonadaceae bacterium]